MQSTAATVFQSGRSTWSWSTEGTIDATPAQAHSVDLEHCRLALKGYAMRALRNSADAEDAVQETLAAALSSPERFAGRSSPMTWLHGILKHKIVDIYRRRARETVLDDLEERDWSDEAEASFTADGHWCEQPASWGNPEAALSRRDFYEVLESCIACLPARAARVFTMRDLMDLEVSEICDTLGITSNNCLVLLHRARMKLRVLLEQRWFATPAAGRG